MRRKTDPLLANGPIILAPPQQAACTRIRTSLRAGDAKRFRDLLAFHLGRYQIASDPQDGVDLDLARLLARALAQATASYEKLDANRREWLRVAIEYFVLDADATSDVKATGGLSDDATVVATILEYCGFHQLSKPIRDYLA
jgi:hypothetical protein